MSPPWLTLYRKGALNADRREGARFTRLHRLDCRERTQAAIPYLLHARRDPQAQGVAQVENFPRPCNLLPMFTIMMHGDVRCCRFYYICSGASVLPQRQGQQRPRRKRSGVQGRNRISVP